MVCTSLAFKQRFLVYVLADSGCIDDWELAHIWEFETDAEEGPSVVALKWLNESREVSMSCRPAALLILIAAVIALHT